MPDKASKGSKEHHEQSSDSPQIKKHFTEPKLKFIEPKLTKHEDATKITDVLDFLVPSFHNNQKGKKDV